jgi:hypothetical protein
LCYRLVAIVVVVVVPVVVIFVVFMVPVAFVISPALGIVVPMPMAPVSSSIWRTLPDAGCPHIAASIDSPISIHPDKAFAWRWWTPLVA